MQPDQQLAIHGTTDSRARVNSRLWLLCGILLPAASMAVPASPPPENWGPVARWFANRYFRLAAMDSTTVRSTCKRAWRLSSASTSVQGACSVWVRSIISRAAI